MIKKKSVDDEVKHANIIHLFKYGYNNRKKVLSAIHKKICSSLLMNDTGSVDMVKPNVKKHGNSDIKC
jgi:hypothetical protein